MDSTNTPCEKLLASLIAKDGMVAIIMHNGEAFSGKLLYVDATNIVLGHKSKYTINAKDPIFNVSVLTKTEIASLRFNVTQSVLNEHLCITLNKENDDGIV